MPPLTEDDVAVVTVALVVVRVAVVVVVVVVMVVTVVITSVVDCISLLLVISFIQSVNKLDYQDRCIVKLHTASYICTHHK